MDQDSRPTAGEKIADGVVSGMGSWRFIIIQSAIVGLWVLANGYLLSRPFDAFPFILLNLAFSTQAAYASPLILMAGNRTAAVERAKEERRVAAEQQQLARIEELDQKIDEHVATLHELIQQIHRAVPDTGCEHHAPQLVCRECAQLMGEK